MKGEAEQGVAFPEVDGRRSTSATGRAVFADAARAVDGALASEIEAERDWRNRYLVVARRLLEAALTGPHDMTALPAAGLESLHRRFVFLRDGDSVPLGTAVRTYSEPQLHTVTVEGRARSGAPKELSVPFRGERLRGDGLHRRLDRWVQEGIAEPSFAEAVRLVMANPDWLDLSELRVAVLGAGAEMGPLHSLCQWGATVIPLDLGRADVWSRILATVRHGSGTAHVPVRSRVGEGADDDQIAAAAGADLITEMPEIATWLSGFDGPLTLGNYVYADGATHVKVSMAVDAVTTHLAAGRPDLSIAVLATPTDVFAVPEEVVAASRSRLPHGPISGTLQGLLRTVSGGRLLAPNYDDVVTTGEGMRLGIADSLVRQQGPNYALAKRLQRWRASVAREQGLVTSVNVAPPTRTRSVLRNRAFAAAYAGASRVGIEVFDPSTSNTLMAALLVHGLRNPKAAANPATPLGHHLELFWQGANHGGLWRNPFAARSVLGLAVVLGVLPRGA